MFSGKNYTINSFQKIGEGNGVGTGPLQEMGVFLLEKENRPKQANS